MRVGRVTCRLAARVSGVASISGCDIIGVGCRCSESLLVSSGASSVCICQRRRDRMLTEPCDWAHPSMIICQKTRAPPPAHTLGTLACPGPEPSHLTQCPSMQTPLDPYPLFGVFRKDRSFLSYSFLYSNLLLLLFGIIYIIIEE